MKITISKAERQVRALFSELVDLGLLRAPEGDLFLHHQNNPMPPVGLPRNKRLPLPSRARYVALRPRPRAKVSASSPRPAA
jgi:hypothetical protein